MKKKHVSQNMVICIMVLASLLAPLLAGCQMDGSNGDDGTSKEFTVTIGQLENPPQVVSVAADPSTATAGMEVLLRIESSEGYRVKTLTYRTTIDPTSIIPIDLMTKRFLMPPSDLTVTVAFEAEAAASEAETGLDITIVRTASKTEWFHTNKASDAIEYISATQNDESLFSSIVSGVIQVINSWKEKISEFTDQFLVVCGGGPAPDNSTGWRLDSTTQGQVYIAGKKAIDDTDTSGIMVNYSNPAIRTDVEPLTTGRYGAYFDADRNTAQTVAKHIFESPMVKLNVRLKTVFTVTTEADPKFVTLKIPVSSTPSAPPSLQLTLDFKIVGQTLFILNLPTNVSIESPITTGTLEDGILTFTLTGIAYIHGEKYWYIKSDGIEVTVGYTGSYMIHDGETTIEVERKIRLGIVLDQRRYPSYLYPNHLPQMIEDMIELITILAQYYED